MLTASVSDCVSTSPDCLSVDFKALSAGGHGRPVMMLDTSFVSEPCLRTKLRHKHTYIGTCSYARQQNINFKTEYQ